MSDKPEGETEPGEEPRLETMFAEDIESFHRENQHSDDPVYPVAIDARTFRSGDGRLSVGPEGIIIRDNASEETSRDLAPQIPYIPSFEQLRFLSEDRSEFRPISDQLIGTGIDYADLERRVIVREFEAGAITSGRVNVDRLTMGRDVRFPEVGQVRFNTMARPVRADLNETQLGNLPSLVRSHYVFLKNICVNHLHDINFGRPLYIEQHKNMDGLGTLTFNIPSSSLADGNFFITVMFEKNRVLAVAPNIVHTTGRRRQNSINFSVGKIGFYRLKIDHPYDLYLLGYEELGAVSPEDYNKPEAKAFRKALYDFTPYEVHHLSDGINARYVRQEYFREEPNKSVYIPDSGGYIHISNERPTEQAGHLQISAKHILGVTV